MVNENPLTPGRLLRIKDVLKIIPISKSSFYAGIKAGKYHAFGKPQRNTILICEGLATGATLPFFARRCSTKTTACLLPRSRKSPGVTTQPFPCP